MPLTSYPGILTGAGSPFFNLSPLMTTGRMWFVSSVAGLSGNTGDDPMRPMATLQAAFNKCRANKDDYVILMPGHTETISTATAVTLATAGVTVIGMGAGPKRPTFTLGTAATTTINVTAANIEIHNCIFAANFADITSAVTLGNAPGLRLIDCEFRDTSAILNFLSTVTTDTTSNHADDLRLDRCRRLGAGATAATNIINMLGTNRRLRVTNCYFTHRCVDNAALFMPIATTKIVTDMEVADCIFNFFGVSSASVGVLISTDVSTNTGYIARCYVKHLDATAEVMCTASSGFIFMDLKASAVADKQGYLVPDADS